MKDDDWDFQQKLLETYRMEAAEHLEEMTESLLQMERGTGENRDQSLELLYRATHSLKGAARAVGETAVEFGCQILETEVSGLRKSRRELGTADFDALQNAVSVIEALTKGTEGVLEVQVAEALQGLDSPREEDSDREARTATPTESPPAPPEPMEVSPPSEAAREYLDSRPGAELDSFREESQAPDTVRIRVDRLEQLMTSSQELRSVIQLTDRLASRVADLESNVRSLPSSDPGRLLATEVGQEAEVTARITRNIVNLVLREFGDVMIVPIGFLLRYYAAAARKLAREQGKFVEVVVNDGGVEIDKRIVDSIRNGLLHAVRNCVDHGIERPDERQTAGKESSGTITFSAIQQEAGMVKLTLSDDGAGVNLEKLRAHRRLQDESISDEKQLLQKVFEPDVSTRSQATMISGRGMGLAIVRENVEFIGGSVEMASQQGRGTTLTLRLPTHYARYRGLLVRESDHLFLFPTSSVLHVISRRDERVRSVRNTLSVVADESLVTVFRLAELLGLPVRKQAKAESEQILLIVAGDKRIAFLVDEVIQDIEMVVRPLGPHLAGLRHITGAAVLADGEVVPVINPHHLVTLTTRVDGVVVVRHKQKSSRPTVPHVLIVEDSVTSRMLLRSILDGAGYRTSVAKDGVEAWQLLETEQFDIVVSDVDMPRMNGFVLTHRIRQSEALGELPVILVTALSSDDQRKRGLESGADAYLTKGGFDQAELIHTIERLI